jgi:hypothetical protein
MQSFFDSDIYFDTIHRLNKLTPDSKPLWGKMNAAQMFAHCKEVFKIPLSDAKLPRKRMGILLGWVIKSKLYNDSPWKKNLPTSPDFKIVDKKDFYIEKLKLTELAAKFYSAGPGYVGKFPHPFFGKFTPEQWGKSMYKHLDHHLRQFGV